MTAHQMHKFARAVQVAELQRKQAAVKHVRPERRAGLLREIEELKQAIHYTDRLYALLPVEVRGAG